VLLSRTYIRTHEQISFRHLGTLSDVPDCVPGLNVVIANSLCPGIQNNCVGANQQYASVADCVAYVGTLPTATWDKANQVFDFVVVCCLFFVSLHVACVQANIPCVSLHLLLTFMFPDIHCPHVGPTVRLCFLFLVCVQLSLIRVAVSAPTLTCTLGISPQFPLISWRSLTQTTNKASDCK
jgi:hypothetical protein